MVMSPTPFFFCLKFGARAESFYVNLLREFLGIVLKREEAILVLKELLDSCMDLDGHSLELAPPNVPNSGYQIIIKGILDQETKQHIQNITTKHQLTTQTGNIWKTKRTPNKTEPDTHIIYKLKNNPSC
jgi:hypothetical protein